jgi:glucose repression regulatory protein TUP1
VESESLFFVTVKSEGTDGRYEAEIARLRRELEARGGGGVAEPPEGSKPAEYERSMYPTALGAPPSNGDSRMSPSSKLHGQRLTSVRSPYPPPGLRTDDRERQDRDRVVSDRETPRGRVVAPPISSPPTLLSDLDPDNVSRELKKEGGDWVAVWSSQSKKMLDVSLVHTLNHET